MNKKTGAKEELKSIVHSIQAQFDLIMVDTNEVDKNCEILRNHIRHPLTKSDIRTIGVLLTILKKKSGSAVKSLYNFFEDLLSYSPDPWPLLKGMLESRDPDLVRQTLEIIFQMILDHSLQIDYTILIYLAQLVDMDNSPLNEKQSLKVIKQIIQIAVIQGRPIL